MYEFHPQKAGATSFCVPGAEKKGEAAFPLPYDLPPTQYKSSGKLPYNRLPEQYTSSGKLVTTKYRSLHKTAFH